MRNLLYLALGLFLFHTALASQTKVLKDIAYVNTPSESQYLDVCPVHSPGLHPIAILIHGGGWSTGDKSGSNHPGDGADITPLFKPLNDAGFVWFSLNYRLAPKNRWPVCYDDIKSALAWIKLHASDYGGDVNHITLIGHSAGGHLAFLIATEKDPALRVESIVGCAPVTDFVYELPIRKRISPSLQMLHGVSQDITQRTTEILRETSPINFVHSAMSPILIIHGQEDKTVPIQESINFQTKVKDFKGVCDIIEISGAPHRLLSYADHDVLWTSKMVTWILAHQIIVR